MSDEIDGQLELFNPETLRRRARKGEARAWLAAHLRREHDPDRCIDWPFGTSRGYGQIVIDEDGTREYVHRAVCRWAHGEPPTERHQAAHACHRPICVNPLHVRWRTPAENTAENVEHCDAVKLTTTDVVRIRAALEAGELQAVIAERYGISQPTVSNIATGETWGWLR